MSQRADARVVRAHALAPRNRRRSNPQLVASSSRLTTAPESSPRDARAAQRRGRRRHEVITARAASVPLLGAHLPPLHRGSTEEGTESITLVTLCASVLL